MPLTTRGELTFIISNDLKGLGDNDGPALAFTFEPPSLLPVVLPWLGLLALLVLKTNRHAGAWFIIGPAAGAFLLLGFAMSAFPEGVASQISNGVRKAFEAVVFGLAAIGLLAPQLQHRVRFVSFLKTLVVCEFAMVAALAARNGSETLPEVMGLGFSMSIWVFLNLAALWLGALICRRKYRPLLLGICTVLILTAMVLVISMPLFAFAAAASGQSLPWQEFFLPVGAFGGGAFAVLLPFFLTLFFSRFYRERLQTLLHLEPSGAPPEIHLAQAPAAVP